MEDLFKNPDLETAKQWVVAGAVLVAWCLVLWSASKFILSRLRRLAAKSKLQFDDVLVAALSAPVNALILLSGAWMALKFSPLLDAHLQTATQVLQVGFLFAMVYFADHLLQGFLVELGTRHEAVQKSRVMFSAILHVLVWVVGGMMVLGSMGVSITPLIASLGVGSLAVALALQSTLANLFSGFYILLDKPVQVGDFIKLESGEEGYVDAIGWRSTRVRMLANNTIVLPNSKLSETQVLNYYLPEPECAVLVQVGVDYDSDLGKVEKATIEVARGVQKEVEGAVAWFDPFIRYHTFADSSVNFTVILRAKEFTANYLMKHEFIKRLHERYRKEGIVIPFPQRTVEFRGTPSMEVRSKGPGSA